MVTSRSQRKFSQKGSLLLEVILVVSIVTVVILAGSTVAQKSIYLIRQSIHQSEAAFLLEEGGEATRIIRDNSWSGISGLTTATDYYLVFSGGTWTLSPTPSQVGIFTRKIVISSAYRDANQDLASSGTIDEQSRLVTVSVSWIEGGATITKTLQFYLADIFS